jgi:hypothetical protein
MVLGGSPLGLMLGTFFLDGIYLSLGEIPSMAPLVQEETMLLEVPPSLGNSLFGSASTLW